MLRLVLALGLLGCGFPKPADVAGAGDAGSNGSDVPMDARPNSDAPSGSIDFARYPSNPGDQTVAAVAADQAGNLYMAGNYSSDGFMLGSVALPTSQQGYAFLAKIDAAGGVVWVQPLAAPGTVMIHGLVVDTSGNPILLGGYATDGTTQGQLALGNSIKLSSQNVGTGWLFVAKFSPQGAAQWAAELYDPTNPVTDTFYPPSDGPASYVAAGPDGSIEVLTRSLADLQVQTGATQSTGHTIAASGDPSTVYLVELSTSGDLAGTYSFGCHDSTPADLHGFAANTNSNLATTYLGLHCVDVDTLPGSRGVSAQPNAAGDTLLQLSRIGTGQYGANGEAGVSVVALATDSSGDAYDSRAGSVLTIERRNATSLDTTWKVTGARATGTSTAVSLDVGVGSVVAVGARCTGQLAFDPSSTDGDLSCRGVALATYRSSDGAFRWAKTFEMSFGGTFRSGPVFGVANSSSGLLFGAGATSDLNFGAGTVTADASDLLWGLLAP